MNCETISVYNQNCEFHDQTMRLAGLNIISYKADLVILSITPPDNYRSTTYGSEQGSTVQV